MFSVSVIIPTYNRLVFLKEAVASVLEQSLQPTEILIIDDGSTDGTWEWLQTLVSDRVKIFRQTHRGVALARNRGVGLATGSFVAFLDSDDKWLKDKLKIQVEFLQTHPECPLCQTDEIWIRHGIRVNPHKKHFKPPRIQFEDCLPLCRVSLSAVMMKKDFFLELGGFDPDLPVCEDYDLWLRAALRVQIPTLPEKLTVKRGGHSDQLSQKFPAMDRFRVLALEKILREELLTEGQKAALLAELEKKLRILSKGFRKRFPEEEDPYQKKWNLSSPLEMKENSARSNKSSPVCPSNSNPQESSP